MQFNSTIIFSATVHHFVLVHCSRSTISAFGAPLGRPGACAVVGGGACTGREHENWSNT